MSDSKDPASPPWLDAYRDILESYEKESDRAVAILAAAFLEQRIQDALRTVFVDSPAIDRLFESYSPLSTFSAKIDIAYALGYVPARAHKDLNLIRKIRNHFAHHPGITSFDVSPVRDWIASLTPFPQVEGVRVPKTLRDNYAFAVTLCIAWVCLPLQLKTRPKVPA